MQRAFALIGLSLVASALAACKPPPTDADLARDMPQAAPTYASDPLPSPDTQGAMWALSPQSDRRIIYGIPGQPALVAIECGEAEGAGVPDLQITRLSPADEGAGALLAIIGNGAIGRIEVDATKQGSRYVWQGRAPASDTIWEPFEGPRKVTVTVPGAGMVTLNPSETPWTFLSECRGIPPEIEPPEYEELEFKPELTPIP